MRLVLDASVALKWILDSDREPDVSVAGKLLREVRAEAHNVYAPPHWIAEILGVVSRQEPSRAMDAAEAIYDLRVRTIASRSCHEHAARLSIVLNHHLFDTLYHAVAIEYGATLLTADARYFVKARPLGNIELLRHFNI